MASLTFMRRERTGNITASGIEIATAYCRDEKGQVTKVQIAAHPHVFDANDRRQAEAEALRNAAD